MEEAMSMAQRSANQPVPEPEFEVIPETKPEPKAENKPKTESKPKPKAQTKSKQQSKPKAETEPPPPPRSEQKPEKKPEPKSEPVLPEPVEEDFFFEGFEDMVLDNSNEMENIEEKPGENSSDEGSQEKEEEEEEEEEEPPSADVPSFDDYIGRRNRSWERGTIPARGTTHPNGRRS
jgi:hypothetical protein